MYRTLVGDFQESLTLLGAECAFQTYMAIDAIDHTFLDFTVEAILGMHLVVSEPYPHPVKGQLFVIGVEPQRHRCAGAEGSEQQIVRGRTGIEPSHFDRLIGKTAVMPAWYLLLEFARTCLAHKNGASLNRTAWRDWLVEIAFDPGGNDVGYVNRIALLAQQVIGAGKRDETFWMLCDGKNTRGIFDTDYIVSGRLQDQQCLAQIFQTFLELLFCNIIDKFALDTEWPPGELNLHLTSVSDRFDLSLEQARDVRRIVGCGNCNDRMRVRNAMRCREYGRAAQTVADQDCRRTIRSP